MPRKIAEALLLSFLGVIGINWPELPYHARLADLVFIPLAVGIVVLPGAKWTWRWVDLAVAGYLLGAVPSVFNSLDRYQSILELGRELYLVAIYAVFAIAARRGFARTTARGLVVGAGTLSVLGLAVLGIQMITGARVPLIGETMQLPYIGSTLRLRALTATPAMFACVLTAALPFAITFCRERGRAFCVASIVMLIAALFTVSHVLAGLGVAVLITSWASLASWPRVRRLAVAAVLALIVAFNFAATISITSITYGDATFEDATPYQYAVDQGRAQIGGAAITYNVMSYARIKAVALHAIAGHPIAGVGLDQFHVETRLAYAKGVLTGTYREIDPHSTLLGRLAECGLIGGITLVLLWFAWGSMARDVVRGSVEPALGYAAMAGLAGLVVASINADIMNFRFVWVAAGLLRGLFEAGVSANGRP
ncbi:MAG: hypothetical protein K2Y23_03515 [Cyanobacteria bacterium]|nr:hypothetical protein [Cyanobacteriota bacterium]